MASEVVDLMSIMEIVAPTTIIGVILTLVIKIYECQQRLYEVQLQTVNILSRIHNDLKNIRNMVGYEDDNNNNNNNHGDTGNDTKYDNNTSSNSINK